MKSIRVPLQLDPQEEKLLDTVCEAINASRNQAIRMMIRQEASDPRLAVTHSQDSFRHVIGKYGKAVEIPRPDGRKLHFYIHPYRTSCVVLLLDPEDYLRSIPRQELEGESELIDRILDLQWSEYNWETEEFISICADLGLDVDAYEPKYVNDFAWIVTGLQNRQQRFAPTSSHWELILDLLDLLRTDIEPDLTILDRAKTRYDTLSDKEKADIYREALAAAEKRKLKSAHAIEVTANFLPSWSRFAGLVSVYLWSATHEMCDEDGWCPDENKDLEGVVALPSGPLSNSQSVIYDRLEKMGVIVLKPYEVDAYLEGEGAYWYWRNKTSFGRMPLPRQPRKPSATEVIKWHIHKADTPIYNLWKSQQDM